MIEHVLDIVGIFFAVLGVVVVVAAGVGLWLLKGLKPGDLP